MGSLSFAVFTCPDKFIQYLITHLREVCQTLVDGVVETKDEVFGFQGSRGQGQVQNFVTQYLLNGLVFLTK